MTRPWLILSVLGASLLAGLAAVGWISTEILRLDRNEREARGRAAQEENIRLSLWRMDSFLAPLIAQESARPYFQYTSFYPAERAYTKMFAEIQANDVIIPSPLLAFESPYVRLHFQLGPEDAVTSPQTPTGNMRDLAEVGNYRAGERIRESQDILAEMREKVPATEICQVLPALVPRLPNVTIPGSSVANASASARSNRPSQLSEPLDPGIYIGDESAHSRSGDSRQSPEAQDPGLNIAGIYNENQSGSSNQSNLLEPYSNDANGSFGPRSSVKNQSLMNRQEQSSRQTLFRNTTNYNADLPQQATTSSPVSETLMMPVWVNGNLLLARRVYANGQNYIQGCWLDWDRIRPQMLESIRDLLPHAELVSTPVGGGDETRRLASLPVHLVPGEVPLSGDEMPSPVNRSLALAWVAALLASLLAAIVLWQAMSLSERRGAFVSAVTHELRTPLTTFRLYTDLLTQHPDAPSEKRNEYLITMRREAERLAHLVENVLAYARLERKSVAARMVDRQLGPLVEQSRERLSERAAQAGLKLDVVAPAEAAELRVRVDPGAFEQIVFNLVDNASKYAASASEPVVQVELAREGTRAVVRVRDRGPGISEEEGRKLFRPFSKSARQAAVSAPGVGLGLALSRRLARQLGGELTLEPPAAQKGACFKLELPCRE